MNTTPTPDNMLSVLAQAIVEATMRTTLMGMAEAFEELATEDPDGDNSTLTYREIISVLRSLERKAFTMARPAAEGSEL